MARLCAGGASARAGDGAMVYVLVCGEQSACRRDDADALPDHVTYYDSTVLFFNIKSHAHDGEAFALQGVYCVCVCVCVCVSGGVHGCTTVIQ